MKYHKKTRQSRFFLCLFLVLIAGAIIWKYQSSPPVQLNVNAYVQTKVEENYLQYSKLSYVDFEDEDEIVHEFRNAINNQKTEMLSKSLKTDLADFLAEVLLSKGAGDFERYRKCVQFDPQPLPLGKAEYFYQTWFHRSPPSLDDVSNLAKEMYTLEVQYDGGKHLFAACSFEEKAIRMRCVLVNDLDAIDTSWDLSEDELSYWFGPIANASHHFFVPDVPIEQVVQDHSSVIWVDFQIIVKTKDDDMYPLRIRLWYHPDMSKWIIDSVSRQSTIKGAMYSPSLIF